MSDLFALRLNRLFDTVFPPGRGPHTSAELVAALSSQSIRTSAHCMSQLRAGVCGNPSKEVMEGNMVGGGTGGSGCAPTSGLGTDSGRRH
jgi:hypothetical protein